MSSWPFTALTTSWAVAARRSLIGMDGKAAAWSILEALVAVDVPGAIVGSSAVVPFLVRRFALERVQEDGRNAWLVLRREEAPAGWKMTRFIGRTSELEGIRQAASLAEQRHGQIVAIVGEAGVGKSRLVHEAIRPPTGLAPSLRRRGAVHARHVLCPSRGAAQELLSHPGCRYPIGGERASREGLAGRR